MKRQSKAGIPVVEPAESYFYSQRLSATAYVYMYPLMEPQRFSSTMQKRIEAARPEFLIFVRLHKSDSDTTIFSWTDRYAHSNYTPVGIVDIFADGTEYPWNDAAT